MDVIDSEFTSVSTHFDQKLFFDLIQKRLDTTDYQIAAKLGISRNLYSQYTTGRNKLRVETMIQWFQILQLDEFELIRLIKQSTVTEEEFI